MWFWFRATFWGTLLVLIGLLILLRNTLGWDIPIAGIVWPLILILIGLGILSRPRNVKTSNQVILDEGEVVASEKEQKYDAIFGRGVFDLTKIKLKDKGAPKIEINAVFGGGIIRINPNTPMNIRASSAFGSVKFPDGGMATFGERTYATKSFKEGEPHIFVKASAVFGGLEVVEV